MDVLKVLGNRNRVDMLRALSKRHMHISGIAKELNIATPVALRHVRILEAAGFIERQEIGNTHLLSIRHDAMGRIKKVWKLFETPSFIEVKKGSTLLDALKTVSGLKIEKNENGAYISEVDGRKGYYIYEVNGRQSNKSVDKYLISSAVDVELKMLSPMPGKRIKLKPAE